MGFKAAEFVEPLDFDFAPYADLKGTVPEPSDRAVNKFLKRWQKLVAEIIRLNMQELQEMPTGEALAALPEEERARIEAQQAEIEKALPTTVSGALEAMNDMSFDDSGVEGKSAGELVADRMCEIVDELSGGKPSAAQLLAVPYRPRSQFLGWLVGELTNPEKGKAGSSTTLRAV
jgi:hypothetical protein